MYIVTCHRLHTPQLSITLQVSHSLNWFYVAIEQHVACICLCCFVVISLYNLVSMYASVLCILLPLCFNSLFFLTPFGFCSCVLGVDTLYICRYVFYLHRCLLCGVIVLQLLELRLTLLLNNSQILFGVYLLYTC